MNLMQLEGYASAAKEAGDKSMPISPGAVLTLIGLSLWAQRHGMPALASIVQHSWAADRPKWGNEFVEVAKEALKLYPEKSPTPSITKVPGKKRNSGERPGG